MPPLEEMIIQRRKHTYRIRRQEKAQRTQSLLPSLQQSEYQCPPFRIWMNPEGKTVHWSSHRTTKRSFPCLAHPTPGLGYGQSPTTAIEKTIKYEIHWTQIDRSLGAVPPRPGMGCRRGRQQQQWLGPFWPRFRDDQQRLQFVQTEGYLV
jgi:hypothetical protein